MKFTFISSALTSFLHIISGPFAFAAIARAKHNFMQVLAPSSLHSTTKLGVCDSKGLSLSAAVSEEKPPQVQLPFMVSSLYLLKSRVYEKQLKFEIKFDECYFPFIMLNPL